MSRSFADITFSVPVLAFQERKGSKQAYAGFLDKDADPRNRLTEAEITFISARDSFYQASASREGWPYVQYRGGPTGFLKILDDHTLAYADFRGNRQYISAGNLSENDRVSMILMDYPNRRRLKIWGRTRLIEDEADPDLIASLHDETYRAKPERAVMIDVEAFDWNCPQHIHPRFTIDELEPHIAPLREQIEELAAENRYLKAEISKPKST